MMRGQKRLYEDGMGMGTRFAGQGGDGDKVCWDGVEMGTVLWEQGVDGDEQCLLAAL